MYGVFANVSFTFHACRFGCLPLDLDRWMVSCRQACQMQPLMTWQRRLPAGQQHHGRSSSNPTPHLIGEYRVEFECAALLHVLESTAVPVMYVAD
jgi:hypothetical protein